MKTAKLAGLLMLVSLGVPTPTLGNPEFQWLGNWQFTTSGTEAAWFDSVEADSASGGAAASINVPLGFIGSTPYGEVGFSRVFSLAGSTGGWEVGVDGSLDGTAGGLHGRGEAEMVAGISGEGPPLVLLASGGGGGNMVPISDAGSLVYTLGNGVYAVTGTFTARTIIAPPDFQGDLNFAEVTAVFSLGLVATAVPEPSSILLLSAGALGLAARSIRDRRRPV